MHHAIEFDSDAVKFGHVVDGAKGQRGVSIAPNIARETGELQEIAPHVDQQHFEDYPELMTQDPAIQALMSGTGAGARPQAAEQQAAAERAAKPAQSAAKRANGHLGDDDEDLPALLAKLAIQEASEERVVIRLED